MMLSNRRMHDGTFLLQAGEESLASSSFSIVQSSVRLGGVKTAIQ